MVGAACRGARSVHARQLTVGGGWGGEGPPNTPLNDTSAGSREAWRLPPVPLRRRLGWRGCSVLLAPSVHVRQLLESGPPVIQVIVVLVPGAGRVQRADGACGRAAPFVVEDQQGVVGGCRGVIVSGSESLGSQRHGVRVEDVLSGPGA